MGSLFEQQVLPNADLLYAKALRLTRNPCDAQDLVQDTLLKAFTVFDRFQQGTNLKAWLSRILMNAFVNSYRKRRREPYIGCLDDLEDWQYGMASSVTSSPSRSAESEAIDHIPDAAVKDALRSLPEQFQLTVYFADVEGFPYEQVAAIMQTPIGTVTSRLHRGRRLLRTLIAPAELDQHPESISVRDDSLDHASI